MSHRGLPLLRLPSAGHLTHLGLKGCPCNDCRVSLTLPEHPSWMPHRPRKELASYRQAMALQGFLQIKTVLQPSAAPVFLRVQSNFLARTSSPFQATKGSPSPMELPHSISPCMLQGFVQDRHLANSYSSVGTQFSRASSRRLFQQAPHSGLGVPGYTDPSLSKRPHEALQPMHASSFPTRLWDPGEG